MIKKERVLVLGAGGQLGQCLKKASERYKEYFSFDFLSSKELDITNFSAVEEYFSSCRVHFCINASAYTAVDLAEENEEKAYAVNAYGVKNLATECRKQRAALFQISTDYVFDGDTSIPYGEDDFTAPLGVYGRSKCAGEEYALGGNPKTIVIRTSWLYSEFGKNFVKTMLRLFDTKKELSVVSDQFGQPTNANDLAEAIFKMMGAKIHKYGIFHYSNTPETTWFDFAQKILYLSGRSVRLSPIATEAYPTPAKRPKRSTLALDKIEREYGVEIKRWERSLEECVRSLGINIRE
ncbi:MAG: dTDP-4-dehydrorhamnose reductase [Bergeyella sp.]|nr:dTDP-4-dehydrorhamnose reductase [Bergeyella sp.]